MKKVTKKLSLLEMEQVMTVLTEEEQSQLIGGDANSLFQAMAMVSRWYGETTSVGELEHLFKQSYGEDSLNNGLEYAGAASFMRLEYSISQLSTEMIFSGEPVFNFSQSQTVFINCDPTGRYDDSKIDTIVVLKYYNPKTGICQYVDPYDGLYKTMSAENLKKSNFIYQVSPQP